MKHICANNRRECDKSYDFSQDGTFLWTKETCIGDEVFYSFLEARGLHEEFLSSFCKERTEQYRYCCPKSASFLSEDTFIACFFAWIANWDIDFRGTDSIDPFCRHNPEVLACDGVHVGVAVRFMGKCTPITKSETPVIKPIGARRFDRVLLPGSSDADKKRRNYIRSYCRYGILKEKNSKAEESDDESDVEEDTGFRQVSEYEDKLLEKLLDPRLKTFISRVLLKQYDDRLMKKCARLILALTSGAALISFFPWSDIQRLEHVFNLIKTDKYNMHDHLDTLESYRVQYADIIQCARKFYMDDEIADFFLYLLETTRRMHTSDMLHSNPIQLQHQEPSRSFDGQRQQLTPSKSFEGQGQPIPSQWFDGQQQQPIPSQSLDGQQQQTPSQSFDGQEQQPIPSQSFDGQEQQPIPSQWFDGQKQQPIPSQSLDGQQQQLTPSQSFDDEQHDQLISPFDPTTGICYYFTSHGGQLRQTPVYSMDGM